MFATTFLFSHLLRKLISRINSVIVPAIASRASHAIDHCRMSRPLKQRNIACARCFRLKRKCDHAKPSCSECHRKGAECLPARSRKTGDSITIPLEYLRQLEKRVAELDHHSTAESTETRDVGVQTVSDDLQDCNDSRRLLVDPDIISSTDDVNSLMIFPELQYPGQNSRRSPLSHYPPDAFSLLTESSFDLPWIDMAPLYSFTSDDSSWLKEMYANMYFSVTHREWPFLDESAWKSWHTETSPEGQDEWRAFFLRMVYAIGASLSSTLQRDPSHSARSKEFYTSAMRYYPHVVGHSSMVLQIQASLLMILYALHSPSSEEITTSVSSVLPFCAAAMTEIRKHAALCKENGSATEADEILSEKMFITCYMLNEVIVSGWDRPVSAAYRVVDDDVSCARIIWPFLQKLTIILDVYSRRYSPTGSRHQPCSEPSIPASQDSSEYQKIAGELALQFSCHR